MNSVIQRAAYCWFSTPWGQKRHPQRANGELYGRRVHPDPSLRSDVADKKGGAAAPFTLCSAAAVANYPVVEQGDHVLMMTVCLWSQALYQKFRQNSASPAGSIP